MADYDSSLPVRTENDGDVVSKIADATIPSQQLKVYANGSIDVNTLPGSIVTITDGTDPLAINPDGSINVTDNGGSLTVDATNLDIRDLVFATDKVDATGSQVGVTNLPTTVDTNYGTVGANTIRTASQIGNATGAADFNAGATTAQTLRVAANLLDSTGNPFTLTNPLAVVITDATPGTSVNDYDTTAAVAAGASDTHTYTVPGGETFYFNQIEASASGKMKIEVQVNGVTKWVQFNSTAETNMTIHIDNPITVAAAGTVTVIRTNRDNQSQDVYSTISGYLLP